MCEVEARPSPSFFSFSFSPLFRGRKNGNGIKPGLFFFFLFFVFPLPPLVAEGGFVAHHEKIRTPLFFFPPLFFFFLFHVSFFFFRPGRTAVFGLVAGPAGLCHCLPFFFSPLSRSFPFFFLPDPEKKEGKFPQTRGAPFPLPFFPPFHPFSLFFAGANDGWLHVATLRISSCGPLSSFPFFSSFQFRGGACRSDRTNSLSFFPLFFSHLRFSVGADRGGPSPPLLFLFFSLRFPPLPPPNVTGPTRPGFFFGFL